MKNKFIWLFVIGMQCMAITSVHAISDNNAQVGRLSIEQRHEIITKKLENIKKSSDLNLQLLAGWIAIDEKDGIEMVVDKALSITKKEKSDVLTMRHCEKAYYELDAGSERGLFDPARLMLTLINNQQ